MTATILCDTSFLLWLERCDMLYHERNGAPALSPLAGLDRLRMAGFRLVFPNEVLRELFDIPSTLFTSGMERSNGVLYLDDTHMKQRGPLGVWLSQHLTEGDCALYGSADDFGKALGSPQHPPKIALVAAEEPDFGPNTPRAPGGGNGDREIVALTDAIQRHPSRTPVLVLSHDRQLNQQLIALEKRGPYMFGSYRHFFGLLGLSGMPQTDTFTQFAEANHASIENHRNSEPFVHRSALAYHNTQFQLRAFARHASGPQRDGHSAV